MRRRDFIGMAMATRTLPIPVAARNEGTFSKSGDRFLRALAETILPGADAGETIRLLHGLLDETVAARFQTGVRKLEKKLTIRFSERPPSVRVARLKTVLKNGLPEDATLAYDIVRRVALIELFSRRAGRDLLAVPFRTAP